MASFRSEVADPQLGNVRDWGIESSEGEDLVAFNRKVMAEAQKSSSHEIDNS